MALTDPRSLTCQGASPEIVQRRARSSQGVLVTSYTFRIHKLRSIGKGNGEDFTIIELDYKGILPENRLVILYSVHGLLRLQIVGSCHGLKFYRLTPLPGYDRLIDLEGPGLVRESRSQAVLDSIE
ncbi:hypothetical protein CRG98_043161 [Punica granatum]|uniref:Uncharacterized protein n=1 Tax=Punica granatum TaxID=22663 RepID=A0A2I0HXV1_PUNGR|nr:hypothetical protein CRG98_043161 [Punica granatum]